MSDSNSGHCSSKSDPGVPVCNSISLPPQSDFDGWDWDFDDAVFPGVRGHSESDDDILRDLVLEEQSIISPDTEDSVNQQSIISRDTEDSVNQPFNDYLMEIFADVDSPDTGISAASKNTVETLPLVGLKKEDMVFCAICKDDIEEGEIANKLTCSHFYHRACIVPWLEIKNTCPVCRYELPTD